MAQSRPLPSFSNNSSGLSRPGNNRSVSPSRSTSAATTVDDRCAVAGNETGDAVKNPEPSLTNNSFTPDRRNDEVQVAVALDVDHLDVLGFATRTDRDAPRRGVDEGTCPVVQKESRLAVTADHVVHRERDVRVTVTIDVSHSHPPHRSQQCSGQVGQRHVGEPSGAVIEQESGPSVVVREDQIEVAIGVDVGQRLINGRTRNSRQTRCG